MPQPAKTGLTSRTATHAAPTVSVNEQARVTKQFTDQAQETKDLKAQVTFVASVPALINQLEHPEQVPQNSPFFILVNDGGKLVKIIPPDPGLLQDKEKYQALKTQLLEQLNALGKQYEGAEGKALGEKALAAEANLEACRIALAKAGVPEPQLPNKPVMFTFSSLAKATPSTEPAKPVPANTKTDEGEFVLYPEQHATPKPPPGPTPHKILPDLPDSQELSQQRLKKRPVTKPVDPVAPREVDEEFRPKGHGLQKIKSTFLQPAAGDDFANIFQSAGNPSAPGKIASVNSGHPDLAVGHSGINAEFRDQINNPTFYQKLHENMVKRARDDSPFMTFEPSVLKSSSTLQGAAMYRPEGATDNHGTIFFDVFKSHPGENEANSAMMYAVAPNGKSATYPATEEGKRQWLLEIKDFSGNMLTTQNAWNVHAQKKGLPVIPVLRTPMVGGDIFRHPLADKNEVAAAIQAGFDDALDRAEQVTITDIQYEETADQHFKNVLLAKGSKRD